MPIYRLEYVWEAERLPKARFWTLTITIAGLTQRGYEPSLTNYYKVSPHHQSSPLFHFVLNAVYETSTTWVL